MRAFFYRTELKESVAKFSDGDGSEIFLLNILVKREGDRIDIVPHPGTRVCEDRKIYVIHPCVTEIRPMGHDPKSKGWAWLRKRFGDTEVDLRRVSNKVRDDGLETYSLFETEPNL